jgi:hypothetical protein
MSGVPVPPPKLSKRQRLLAPFRSRSRASSPPPSLSTQAFTSSTPQSPSSSSTQIFASSSPPSAGLDAANLPNASATVSLSQQATSKSSSSNKLLSDALKRLSDRDHATLREYILPTSNDIDLALEQALAAAKEKQRRCLEKRWRFTFAGREFILKEEADKVVSWLNRFKDVGNVAASADPVHAGLPWAGIRLLLEVRILSPKLEPTNLTFQSIGCHI